MTIKRQYTLPNCNLILEGMSSEDINNLAAPMTILLNVECQFPGTGNPLVGGRDFLEGLIQAVNVYAQSLLSGVTAARAAVNSAHGVTLRPHGQGPYHVLAVASTDKADDNPPAEVKLTTAQLFDLMDAVDQLLADSQTLPDLTLTLAPLARRETQAQVPFVQQAAPIAVGTSGLAAAAALLLWLPVPELEPIRVEEGGATPTEASTSTTSAAETAGGETPPNAEGTESEISDDTLTASRTLARLSDAPEITDEDALSQLQSDLVEALEADWTAPADLDVPLTYRVAVSTDGDLLGYRHGDNAALANVENTPLPDLTYRPLNIDEIVAEPVAQFEVTLDPDGSVVVVPTTALDGDN